MDNRLDLTCSCVVLSALFLALAYVALRRLSSNGGSSEAPVSDRVRATALPLELCRALLTTLEPVVRVAVKRGVTANSITASSLIAGVGVGASLAAGHVGVAGLLFVLASCGDALDGLVARASHTESASGALLDASVDRYEEFFAFGGLAIHFRSNGWLLGATLLALAGSFMVSYGSAQAEARHIAVPRGLMRRPERAACLGVGLVLGPLVGVLVGADAIEVPVVVAVVVIGVVANICAVQRIRSIAVSVQRPCVERAARAAVANVSVG